MPELPEVETARRGLLPHLLGQKVRCLQVYDPRLRWAVPSELGTAVRGLRIEQVTRRAKYLLLHTSAGEVLIHLGMSGSLRVLPRGSPRRKHDHVDLLLGSGKILRFNDPRRFGCWLWQPQGTLHPLLRKLGPEPLSDAFTGEHLWRRARGKQAAVKGFLMDQSVVVGIGNIYASEALFLAGIHPQRPAGSVSRTQYQKLCDAARAVLAHAIERGGTTLRDFLQPDGQPGYFEQELWVYGRAGAACRRCGGTVRAQPIAQRNSFWCPGCQPRR